MKKILTLLCMAFVCICAHAGKNVTVTQGSTDFLKESVKLGVTFDWSQAKYDNNGDIEEKLKDFDKMKTYAQTSFIAGFNANAKKARIIEEGDTDYSIVVKVTNVDMFFSAMSIIPGYKFKVWATVTVKNVKTGEMVCEVIADEVKGDRDFKIDDSYRKCMKLLGELIAKAK